MHRFLVPLLALLALSAGALPAQEASSFSSVLSELEKIRTEPGMRTAAIGFCMVAVDAADDSEAVGYCMDTSLIPASTMKAITTATANELLGADFRFETKLQHTGTIRDDGTLLGDLIVRGGGDPTLGSSGIADTFAKWRNVLAEAGIRRIEGAIVGDGSVFGTKRVPDTWQWNDMGNYYGAGACGLTFHENQFFCTFRTIREGLKATLVGTDPRLPDIHFFNEMRVGPPGSGDKGRIYGAPYGNVFYLRGSLPANGGTYTIKGALPDPARFCARAFTKDLAAHDIPVSDPPTTARLLHAAGKTLGKRTDLHVQRSGPLGPLLKRTNHKSHNLRAECIHRMIGLAVRSDGSTESASKAVRTHWADRGIDMTGFFMDDGCGLSRSNAVTARQMALILRHAANAEGFEAFYDSLPVAGRSGTLRSLGRGSAAEGRVHAKSGTLDRIKNYAGYVNARSGRRYAFALFINNYSGNVWDVKSRIVRAWNRIVAE
jgi:serine-type D-Ala-D-Ala carboxypeptidase/endopeptidase (penicillin-binding protein 4)